MEEPWKMLDFPDAAGTSPGKVRRLAAGPLKTEGAPNRSVLLQTGTSLIKGLAGMLSSLPSCITEAG